jgi:Zn-dependent metalloprotease
MVGGAITLDARGKALEEDPNLYYVRSKDTRHWTDPTTVSLHANMQQVHEYYYRTFGRTAIASGNESVVAVAHWANNDGSSMANAFWSDNYMIIGDGNKWSGSWGSLDVIAHELTHGVVAATADLEYLGQSGALNESFADVFAMCIDRDDPFIADEVIDHGFAIALRDMSDPSNPNVVAPQPDHMNHYMDLPLTEDYDNGGVHVNSGIPNRAAWLIASALGFDVTEQIYYQALSYHLGPRADFADARNALVLSARELYGDEAADVVSRAFCTVGIGDCSPVTSGVETTHNSSSTAIVLNAPLPNPVCTTTMISFELPQSATVDLSVVNTLGQTVAQAFSGQLAGGLHSFTLNSRNLPEGTYFIQLRSGNQVQTSRMIVQR